MNQTLQEAITGAPVTVNLGGKPYPLAYPMQAVILYKKETARLDRERTQGRPRLASGERRELLARRRKALLEAQPLRGSEPFDTWRATPQFEEYDALLEEANALKVQLDEDA